MRFYLRLALLDHLKIVMDRVAYDRYQDDEDDGGQFIFDGEFRVHTIYYSNYFYNMPKKKRKRGENKRGAFVNVKGKIKPAGCWRLLQKSQFCHSRSVFERESGSNCLKNHIPDRIIWGRHHN